MQDDNIIDILRDLKSRVETLEKQKNVSLNFGTDGALILPQYTADPTPTEARIYYNTTTGAVRYYNGITSLWTDL